MAKDDARQRSPLSQILVPVGLAGLLILIGGALLIVFTGPANQVEAADLMNQGGEGVWEAEGVSLRRTSEGLEVELKAKRPLRDSYDYPTADLVPAGASHPPVVSGDIEVYTLWLFTFNHPELCRDPLVCRSIDISGDEEDPKPSAQGGVYRLDGVVAEGELIEMSGTVLVGDEPRAGAALTDPFCSFVHVGMAPHGGVLEGDDLTAQLNTAIGNPNFWWAAQFEELHASNGC